MEYDIEKFRNLDLDVFLEDTTIPVYEHWYRMAEAYLSVCFQLIYDMANGRFECEFFRVKVSVFLFEHSIELFLKFALDVASKKFKPKHSFQKFYNDYCLYYSEEEFKFTSDIENVVKHRKQYPHSTFSRYPGDINGNLWEDDVYIDVISLLERVKLALEDFHRLKPLIIEKYKISG